MGGVCLKKSKINVAINHSIRGPTIHQKQPKTEKPTTRDIMYIEMIADN